MNFFSIYGESIYSSFETVENYLKSSASNLPSSNLYNSSGRAIPDISAFATNFRTYSFGFGDVSGTSASSPTVSFEKKKTRTRIIIHNRESSFIYNNVTVRKTKKHFLLK